MNQIARFENPNILYLLFLIIPLVAYYIWRQKNGITPTIRLSSIKGFSGAPRTLSYYLRHVPFIVRMAAIGLLAVAMARPQSVENKQKVNTEGIDIVIALDISGSMLARDFDPDRIEAAKKVASQFIMERENDRVGLVVFAGESFTQCPITSDRAALINLLYQVKSGMIEDGTAIGNGLATAINRLKESKAKSKVVILLTDGVNNSGQIAPLAAAEIAKQYGIKVYTIGVGTTGLAPYPQMDMFGNVYLVQTRVEIDEPTLKKISEMTDGKYFRATDNNSLTDIYGEINKMEKTKVEVEKYFNYYDLFAIFAIWALALLLVEFLIRNVYLKQIP